MTATLSTPVPAAPSGAVPRLLLELGPLAIITAAICLKLLYFSALLPGQW